MPQATTSDKIGELTLVDCDVHPGIHLDKIVPYVDEPYRRGVERLSKLAGPIDLYDDDLDTEPGSADSPREIRQKHCDPSNIDYPVLTPLNGYLDVRNPRKDLVVPLMRATNDWLIDYYLDADDSFRMCAQVTTRDPEAAAREIDRISGHDQIVGVLLYNTAAAPPLGDAEYDPIYKSAAENDLAIAYHGGTSQLQYGFPRLDENLRTWFEAGTVAHLFAQQLTLLSLTRNGTFEKFPDLDFVFLEAGISWAAFMMFRLNGVYWKRRQEAPLLEKSPEEYIRDQCYFGTQPLEEANDPRLLQQALELVGTDSIVFASDYPHWDFDHPDIFEAYSLKFDEDQIQQIMCGNARNVFGL